MLRKADKNSPFATMRPKHHRFVEEYARDWNATAPYKASGLSGACAFGGSERLTIARTA